VVTIKGRQRFVSSDSHRNLFNHTSGDWLANRRSPRIRERLNHYTDATRIRLLAYFGSINFRFHRPTAQGSAAAGRYP
jgi:hypothetical protein